MTPDMTNTIKEDDIVVGRFWREPVRVLRCRLRASRWEIEAVGTKSTKHYANLLTNDDLESLSVQPSLGLSFDGDAKLFFLAIEAHRIRNASQFDPLLAVNVSQVDALPHQIEAVYHHILKNPRVRFLLADDPGAGKTIMAGLLLKELKYRRLVERTLVVVPGHLKDQWRREMKERFGEKFLVVDRGTINASWGFNVWQDQRQVITSLDFAKQDEVLESLRNSHWDLVIVDEAHKMAAYRYGNDVKKTERYRLGEVLSRISRFLLFLTATPHRGDPENFRLLVNLLEPELFANYDLLEQAFRQNETTVFLRRLKEDLKDATGRPLFPPRHVHTSTYRLSNDEKRLYNAVTQYVQESYNKALAKEKRNVAFALLILQRRLSSSVRAARRSLERRKGRLEELLKLGKWLIESPEVDEDQVEDLSEADRVNLEEQLLERLTSAETHDELQKEIDTLDELITLARQAEKQGIETKLGELRKVMECEEISQRREKLLIFTESRDTLEYLEENLKAWGYSVVTLHGAMSLDERIRAEHDFRHTAQVMISTEAGGEGINLQFCSLMVNYDIPWNPNRLEQRMGRIHRYGQQREVHVYNLVASDTREGTVLASLFEKLERIRAALGSDRVFDVIGEIIPGKSLQKLIVEAIASSRTLDEIAAEIRAIPDECVIEKAREAAMEALSTRHLDLGRILGEERRAREQRLVPEYIEKFFEEAAANCKVECQRNKNGSIRVTKVPSELRSNERYRTIFGEVFASYSAVVFDKEAARRLGAEFVAPGHPLLEVIIEKIIDTGDATLQQGATFYDPDGRLDGWLWFFLGEVRDGSDAVAGRRIFAVYESLAHSYSVVSSSVLWDLVPAASPAPMLPELPSKDHALEAFLDKLDSFRSELAQERSRVAAIKEKYGLRSLDLLINDCEIKLMDYETRRAKGEPLPPVEIQKAEERKADLLQRKQQLIEEIQQEQNLSLVPPSLLGVVRVLPQPTAATGMGSDSEVEATGMRVAMDFERQQGRCPEDVSAEDLGFDIRSTDASGAVRYIEVKARATTGPVILTPNEWFKAQRFGSDYWLYVVENAASQPQLFCIQDPAAKLPAEVVVETVRHVVKDWKSFALPAQ